MEMSFLKKMLIVFLIITISTLGLPVISVKANSNPKDIDNDVYYKKVAELIQSRWDDSYFGTAILSVDDNILKIDHHIFLMQNEVKIENGELMIPVEVFEEFGMEVISDSQGVKVKNNKKFVDVTYGEKTMRVNGNKKGMPAEAAIRNGKPVLPISVLEEIDQNFEIIYNEATGEITITNEYQMARLEVKVKEGKDIPKDINAAEIIKGPDGLYVYQFDTAEQAKQAAEILKTSPDAIYAVPDTFLTLGAEPAYSLEELNASYSHLSWGAKRIEAGKYMDYLISRGKQNTSVIVAVLDTGLDPTHSFFRNRHVAGYNFINNNTNTIDIHSHGTHVAGTIIDVTLVLPNVKIMPVKVLGDNGSGSSIGVANGTRWAADNGAKVINMSLGGGHSQSTDDAINYATGKGTTVVVAAGNSGADAKNYCPAHAEKAITVSAFDSADRPASWSNFGTVVDVAAPGVSIVSAIPGGQTSSKSGTSMASPHVAGAVALLLCDNPSLSPAGAKALITASVDPITANTNNRHYGSGILNIGKAAGQIVPQFLIATPKTIVENVRTGQKEKQLVIEYYDNGNVSNITSQATYMSSNAAVATVSATGLITVRAVGSANIIVSYNGKSVTIPVLGENIEPLVIQSSTPANGAVNVPLDTTVINLTVSRKVSKAVTFSLVDTKGRTVSWKQQAIGANYVNITLSRALDANEEYTFTIRSGGIEDILGETIERDFVIKFRTFAGDLGITTTSLAKGMEKTAYNATIAAIGGTTPYTFSATGLPTGLTISSGGIISGTPEVSGTFNVNVTVKDSGSRTATKGFTLIIDPPPAPPVITTVTLSSGKVGEMYNGRVEAAQGRAPYIFSATGLPRGLAMSQAGAITGTPGESGTFNVVVTVKDQNNMTAAKTLTLTIGQQGFRERLDFRATIGAQDNRTYTKSYELDIKATGNINVTAGYTTQGNPTFNMYLMKDGKIVETGRNDKGTSLISANVNQIGKYELVIEVQKKAVTYNIIVLCPEIEPTNKPEIITTVLGNGRVGNVYNNTVIALGGKAPYTFSATGLPKGLALNSAGVITGTPTESGKFNVVITVKDANQETVSKTLALVIEANFEREVIRISDKLGAQDKNTYTKTYELNIERTGVIDINVNYTTQGNPTLNISLIKDGKVIATRSGDKGIATISANLNQTGKYELKVEVQKKVVDYNITATLP